MISQLISFNYSTFIFNMNNIQNFNYWIYMNPLESWLKFCNTEITFSHFHKIIIFWDNCLFKFNLCFSSIEHISNMSIKSRIVHLYVDYYIKCRVYMIFFIFHIIIISLEFHILWAYYLLQIQRTKLSLFIYECLA